VDWSKKNTKNFTYSTSAYFSTEYDYTSIGFGGGISKDSLDDNREFGIFAIFFLDSWVIIRPTELRNGN
jgi:hypothetical protein